MSTVCPGRFTAALAVAALLAGCRSAGIQEFPSPSWTATALPAASEKACERRVNDTREKLAQCIRRDSLWHHLEQFQLIADENPGPHGHGSRNTGTPGYRDSVNYVARLMRRAGYAVTIQRYNYSKFERTATPRLPSRGGVLAESDGGARSDDDYNVIAESRYGDPRRVVVVDAHLDSIYGAGMLDNASGSTTILEVALALARTHPKNRLRFIWFGGEEIGLLGSRYYTQHLTRDELGDIAFDVDVDVTATPNFDILVADPKFAQKVKRFPPNVVPDSKIGNEYFYDYFGSGGVVSRPAWFGNDGTDSLSFALAGVPDTGILTGQDCCKHQWETRLWAGSRATTRVVFRAATAGASTARTGGVTTSTITTRSCSSSSRRPSRT